MNRYESLYDYVKGDRTGSKAWRLEKESLGCGMLSESLGGYLNTPDKVIEDIKEVEDRLNNKKRPRRAGKILLPLIVALAILVIICVVIFGNVKHLPGVGGPNIEQSVTDTAYSEGQLITTPGRIARNGLSAIAGNFRLYSEDGRFYEGSVTADSITTGKVTPPELVSIPGIGLEKFDEYLGRAMHQPEDRTQGEVVMTFKVNRYGRPSQIRVIGFVSREVHQEAIRLVEGGPEWTPTDQTVKLGIIFR